jgi:tRNA-splicing ligase RtcB (3'-phosphate/5'-hydroxy nucleic acid ligase)
MTHSAQNIGAAHYGHDGVTMSMEIKARDLLAAGWPEGPRFGSALRRARELQATGLDVAGVLAALEVDFPKQAEVVELRHAPARLSEAVEVETPAETVSVAASRARMTELLHVPVIKRGALMPDTCPAGAGIATIPVGGAIEVENAILPGAHSADICCSMFASFFADNHPIGELMDQLFASTHFGPGGRPRGKQLTSAVIDEPVWDNLFLSGLQSRARDFLATQGDGNHFAYIGRIEFTLEQQRAIAKSGHTELAAASARRSGGFHVLVTHHGSRGLGADVYKRGMIAAREWVARNATGIPDAAAWLPFDSREGAAYWDALQYVSRWTRANHGLIHEAFLHRIGQRPLLQFGNEHNFVWRRGDSFFHGKGATPAWRDAEGRPLLGLIPLNMAREILLVLGGDNDEFLSFCPHGAGRNLSRKAMLAPYRDAEGDIDPARVQQVLAETTGGLDIRWFNGAPDLSETPLGYKDATKVKAQIERFKLATVIGEIHPLGCIMAGDAPEPPWARKRREKRAAHKAVRREWTAHNEE